MKFCTALKYFKKSLSTSNIKYIQSCQKLVNINSEEIHNVKKWVKTGHEAEKVTHV